MPHLPPHLISELNAGFAHYNAKRFSQALACFDQVLNGAPKLFDAWHLKAMAHYKSGQFDVALTAFREALLLQPKNAELLNNAGNCLKQSGRPFSARKMFENAVGLASDYAPAKYNLAYALLEAGELLRALEITDDLLRVDPVNVNVWLLKSALYSNSADHKTALKCIDEALKYSPDSWLARELQIRELIAIQEFDKAETCIAAYDAISSKKESIHSLKVKCLFESERSQAALAYVEKLPKTAMNAELIGFYIRLVWLLKGESAFNLLGDQLIADAHNYPAFAQMFIQSEIGLNRFKDACRHYDLLPDTVRSSFDGLCLGTNVYEAFPDKLELAGQLSQQAFAIAPEIEIAAMNRARTALQLSEYDIAEQVIAVWRTYKPNSQFWLAYEALCLRGQKKVTAYNRLCDYDRMIGLYDLTPPDGYDTIDDFNAELAKSIERIHVFSNTPTDQSLRNGTQSVRSLVYLEDPVIKAYIQALSGPIEDYIEKLAGLPSTSLGQRVSNGYNIQGCWSVRLKKGGRHVNHVHPEGWISSAYYVATPDLARNSENSAHSGWIKFGQPPFNMADNLDVERWIKPEAGKVVLFPSYFWHGVEPCVSEQYRITAPFDAVPSLPDASFT